MLRFVAVLELLTADTYHSQPCPECTSPSVFFCLPLWPPQLKIFPTVHKLNAQKATTKLPASLTIGPAHAPAPVTRTRAPPCAHAPALRVTRSVAAVEKTPASANVF
ncbi:hypothetical protein V5799_023963 [Amblyomma americanum]|uniref:Secreted protein n=1 Tax=Amblyomma americanum TaxID=6943 RepID=A0AAQ4FHK8_AMBAM